MNKSGCVARKIIGTSTWIEVYQIHGQDSRNSLVEKKKLLQDTCGSESAVRRSKQLPEIWSGMSNAAQKKEKEEWTMEKLKVDNARRLRGIYFIDPEDGEREKKPSKTRGQVGDSYGGGNALQNGNKEVLEEAAVNRKRE